MTSKTRGKFDIVLECSWESRPASTSYIVKSIEELRTMDCNKYVVCVNGKYIRYKVLKNAIDKFHQSQKK